MFASNLPPKVVCVEGEVLSGEWDVVPEELELARGFGEKRMRELLSGRTYARRALQTIGLACPPIGRNQDGSPGWPEGVMGTVSHTRDYYAVALAPKTELHGLGLDVDGLTSVKDSLRKRICTGEESDWLEERGNAEEFGGAVRSRRLTLLFSAKGAFYKLLLPMTRT